MVFLAQSFPCQAAKVGLNAIVREIVSQTCLLACVALFPYATVLYGLVCMDSRDRMVVTGKAAAVAKPVLCGA